MKASTPSLMLFFITSFLAIIFRLLDYESIEQYCRSAVISSLFIYYLVSNNYKISFYKIIVFLALFIRDVFVILKIKESALGSFSCVLLVYILLLCVTIKEFKYFNFNKKDIISILIVILAIGTVCYSVLNLKLENLELDFSLYVVFGIILSLLSIFTTLNYIKNGDYAFFNALLMCISFIISDVFFVIYKFYFYHEVFSFFSIITQFLSYFFMVKYFLGKGKVIKLNNY